jgi:hypothetical protein
MMDNKHGMLRQGNKQAEYSEVDKDCLLDDFKCFDIQVSSKLESGLFHGVEKMIHNITSDFNTTEMNSNFLF